MKKKLITIILILLVISISCSLIGFIYNKSGKFKDLSQDNNTINLNIKTENYDITIKNNILIANKLGNDNYLDIASINDIEELQELKNIFNNYLLYSTINEIYDNEIPLDCHASLDLIATKYYIIEGREYHLKKKNLFEHKIINNKTFYFNRDNYNQILNYPDDECNYNLEIYYSEYLDDEEIRISNNSVDYFIYKDKLYNYSLGIEYINPNEYENINEDEIYGLVDENGFYGGDYVPYSCLPHSDAGFNICNHSDAIIDVHNNPFGNGIISTIDNRYILDSKYSAVFELDTGNFIVKKNNNYGLFNPKTEEFELDIKYKLIRYINNLGYIVIDSNNELEVYNVDFDKIDIDNINLINIYKSNNKILEHGTTCVSLGIDPFYGGYLTYGDIYEKFSNKKLKNYKNINKDTLFIYSGCYDDIIYIIDKNKVINIINNISDDTTCFG